MLSVTCQLLYFCLYVCTVSAGVRLPHRSIDFYDLTIVNLILMAILDLNHAPDICVIS